MHAVVLLVLPGAHLRKLHQHAASYISCKILQIYGFVQVFQARGRQRFLIHMCAMFMTAARHHRQFKFHQYHFMLGLEPNCQI